MNDIHVITKDSIVLDSSNTKENSVKTSVNNIYRWNTVATGAIPFEIVNIAFIQYINEDTGNYTMQLTGKTTSTTNKNVSYYDYMHLGSKLECTGGILRFVGTIDGVSTDVIINAGNSIDFSDHIEGTVSASIDSTSVGQFSYDNYTCAAAYCGFAVKQIVRIEDTVQEDYYQLSATKHVYVDNLNNDPEPTPDPTPDPDPETDEENS